MLKKKGSAKYFGIFKVGTNTILALCI